MIRISWEDLTIKYSGTPLIRTLVIRVANYPYLTETVLHLFYGFNSPPPPQVVKHTSGIALLTLYLYVNQYVAPNNHL